MNLSAPTLRLLPSPEPAPAEPPAPPQALNLIRAVIETMMGRRALHQLRPYLARSAFKKLAYYTDAGALRRTTVGRVRTQMPTHGAVEATVQVAFGQRWLSCAIRLDAREGRWNCTDVTVLTPASLMAA